ncbi:MAG: ATP-dependent sacrificial sulfur transferase LarE [Desulfobacula sp.]|jgi:pyridinium-3,5-biscarboxylic acid mononucleotide sulfurtransferase|nr:ATP-dependent sacrificial sulfur transferase LarE [Desulfobacula sp.]
MSQITNKSYKQKLVKLKKHLKTMPSIALAFSGGVDSSFLLAVAKSIKPQKLLAVSVASEFVPEREIGFAKKMALALKVEHICLRVNILENEKVAINTEERCYHCKKHMFTLIRETAKKLNIDYLLHGVNQDDLNDFRPGLKAAKELGFLSPMVEAGLNKKEIRELSKFLGLETWNKASQSCLATRIPFGVRLKKKELMRVDKAEAFLQDLGFSWVRVRCRGKAAELELAPDHVKKIHETHIRDKVSDFLKEVGFESIILP